MFRSVVALAFALPVAVAASTPALACSPLCTASVTRVSGDRFAQGDVMWEVATGAATRVMPTMRIVTSGGEIIDVARATRAGAAVIVPAVDLPAGSYALEHDHRCLDEFSRDNRDRRTFEVGSASPEPTTVGEAVLLGPVHEWEGQPMVTFALRPSPELVAHSARAAVSIKLGEHELTFGAGSMPWQIGVPVACRQIVEETCGVALRLLPGRHTVTFRAALVGQQVSPAESSVSVDVTCGAFDGRPVVTVIEPGGCSLGDRGRPSWFGVLLVALAALVARRRVR
jgi:hypothetical protein